MVFCALRGEVAGGLSVVRPSHSRLSGPQKQARTSHDHAYDAAEAVARSSTEGEGGA
jgi:hypothetical protein